MKRIILLTLILCVYASTSAADILIKNAKLIESFATNSSQLHNILVQGGFISQVSEKAITVGTNVQVYDAKGRIVTSGLFNSDAQIGVIELGSVQDTQDYASSNNNVTASLRMSDAINPASVLIPYNRTLGITHVLVQPSSRASVFAGIATVIRLSDAMDIVEKSDAGLVVYLGSTGKHISGGSRATSLAFLRQAFADARRYQNSPKNFYASSNPTTRLSLEDLQVLVQVLEKKMPLIVHVDRAVDIVRAIELANKLKIELILAGVIEGWKVAAQIAEAKAPVIIDPIQNLPTSYDTLGARLDNAKLLQQAGVTLLLTGMDWHRTHNAYLVRQSAGNAVANGLDYMAAFNAMTINPARVFGLKKVGAIAQGYQANLVIWSGDPLETINQPIKVILQGKDYPLSSRSTRLRDRYLKKYRQQNTQ